MKQIPIYKFYKHKYGDVLLIDVIDYSAMWQEILKTPTFTETFYSLTLVIDGDEAITLNGKNCIATRGTVICSTPGEIWHFHGNMTMNALNLVFEKEFLLTFFNDSNFLNKLKYLSKERLSPFLSLDEPLFNRLLNLYRQMQYEINNTQSKDQHILRAMLYETLILFSRAEVQMPNHSDNISEKSINRYAQHFAELAEKNFITKTNTEFYANTLCITSNYLNKIVKQVWGKTTKEYLQEQRIQEACKQLRYTTRSIQEIATSLGYETATYFVRSFHKAKGETPLAHRKKGYE